MRLKFCNYFAIGISFYGFFFFLYLLVSALYFAAFCYVLGCTITTLAYWLYMFDKEDFSFKYLKKNNYSPYRNDRLIRNMGRDEKVRSKCKLQYEDVENYRKCLGNQRNDVWLPNCCVKPKNVHRNTEKKDIDSKENDKLLNKHKHLDSSSYENEKKTNGTKLHRYDNTSNEDSKKKKPNVKRSSSKSRKMGRKIQVKKLNKKTEANMKKKENYPVASIKNSV